MVLIGIRPMHHEYVELIITIDNKPIANIICKQIVKSTDGNTGTLIPEKLIINLIKE